MGETSQRDNEIVSKDKYKNLLSPESEKKDKWFFLVYITNGGYYIGYIIKRFFNCPTKKEQSRKDIDLMEQVKLLLDIEDKEANEGVINKCGQFIRLHRIIENTKARRRLEKWASRVIVIYLLVVFLLVLFNYAHVPFFAKIGTLSIDNVVMITILSTTTVNIIGLGLIVLRGHFSINGEENNINNKSNNKTEPTEK